jgi:hypothetical protein
MIGLGVIELLLLLVFGVGGSILWIYMLIDCATNEPAAGNGKLVWFFTILLTHLVGAAIYMLVRRPNRLKQVGA